MKKIRETMGAYLLWLVSISGSIYIFFVLRESLLVLMNSFGWKYYTINLLDKLSTLVVGIMTIVFFLIIYSLYMEKNRIYFVFITGSQVLLYTVVQFIKLIAIGVLQAVDYCIFAVLTGVSIGLYCLYFKLKTKVKH